MEAVAIAGAMNVGVIIIGGAVNIIIHKWNRSKLKKQFNEIVEKMKKQDEEITTLKQSSVNGTPCIERELRTEITDPYQDPPTPSEMGYARPENPRRYYYH